MTSLQQFKVIYRDNSSQSVTSFAPQPQGDWLVFQDGEGEVLRVQASSVEGVQRESLADREKPRSSRGTVRSYS